MRSRPFWICLALVILTGVVYWPVRHFGFVSYDDYQYVYANPHIPAGLTPANLVYAFTTFDTKNYHPLTWVSYLADATFFNARPQPMHVENVIFHAINAILLFVFLTRATGQVWPAAMAAGVFAVHPTHVESVAWISERKDVLSTLFFLLALLSYLKYAAGERRARTRSYAATMFFFVCGLLFKSMLVTFPFLLLLVDWWPLHRIELGIERGIEPGTTTEGVSTKFPRIKLRQAILEKIPFLMLAAVASVLTSMAQYGISASLKTIPVSLRAENAALSYVGYLVKSFWPANLSVLYPYRWEIPLSSAVGDAVLLIAVTVCIAWFGRTWRSAIVGWLWFLGTLVPVIGIVQVGAQSMADRYLYLPSIGLSIAVIWTLAPLVKTVGPVLMSIACIAILIALTASAHHQVGYWIDSDHLFGHASVVLNGPAGAEVQQGVEAEKRGNLRGAERHYQSALQIDPENYEADFNLGNLLLATNPPQAIAHYQAAARKQPTQAEPQINWGVALLKLGDRAGAFSHFQLAEQLDPDSYDAHYNLGRLFLIAGKLPEAHEEFARALQNKPSDDRAIDGLRATQR